MKRFFSVMLAICAAVTCFPIIQAEAETVELPYYSGTAPEAIEPDVAYWIGESGMLTHPDTRSATVYDISTAEQLLGLAEAFNGDFSDKTAITRGKVFRLTADIDLNRGIEWDSPRAESEEGAVTPTNVFSSLGVFYGTIDGQGHTVSGVYSPYGAKGACGGLIGSLRYGGVKDLVLRGGYIRDTDGGALGGLIGEICVDGYTDGSIEIKNVTVTENFTVCCKGKTSGAVGGICGENRALLSESEQAVTVIYDNVSFCGALDTDRSGCAFGYFMGGWSEAPDGIDVCLEMTDCAAYAPLSGKAERQWTLTDTDGKERTTLTRCLETRAGLAVPTNSDTRWVDTGIGPLPITAAYTLNFAVWQATDVRDRAYTDNRGISHTANTYDIRLISTVDTLSWGYVGFAATVYNLTDGTKYIAENTRNRTVYSSILAEGAEVSGQGFDVKGAYMYCFIIENFDAEKDYRVEVRSVMTRKDGTRVESTDTKVFTPKPYDLKAAAEAITPDIFKMVINAADGTATNDADPSKVKLTVHEDSTASERDVAPTVAPNAEFGCSEARFNGINTAWEYKLSQAQYNKMMANGVTIETFIRIDTHNTGHRPLGNQQSGGIGFNLDGTGGTGINLAVIGTSWPQEAGFARAPYKVGEYMHVVAGYDKTTNEAFIYINGEFMGRGSCPHGFGPPGVGNNGESGTKPENFWFVLGGDSNSDGRTNCHFEGAMISANVYARVLSQEQIRLLYANYYYN